MRTSKVTSIVVGCFIVAAVFAYLSWSVQTYWTNNSDSKGTSELTAPRKHIVSGTEPCRSETTKYLVSYDAGTQVTVEFAEPIESAELTLVDGGSESPNLLKIERGGLARQVLDVGDAKNFEICDLNGDGLPDLIVNDAAEATGVSSHAYVYASSEDKFFPLEYGGELRNLSTFFSKQGLSLDMEAVLTNVEVVGTGANRSLIQQSEWHQGNGSTTCWALVGRRLELMAALIRKDDKLRAIDSISIDAHKVQYKIINLTLVEHDWAEEEHGFGSDVNCEEIVTGVRSMPTRQVVIPANIGNPLVFRYERQS